MSIVEKTTAQLVRNRVHDLADMVLDMQVLQQRCAVMVIAPGGVSVKDAHDDEEDTLFSTSLPPLTTPERALNGLEQMVAELRAYQHKEGAQ
ncbi:hypothetical protein [Halomonas alkaliantarctica]|uniref:hypothetical protein n=1 Tax=Halomonas alkaliantarctica TaxID=232346 RepID=UPI0026586A07|nr:hypothetical protein [Halomonas alkaliantarctica]